MMFLKRLYFRIVHGGFSWTFLNCKDVLLHRQLKSRSQVFISPFHYKLHEINAILAKQYRLFSKGKLTDNKEHIEVDQILIDGTRSEDVGDLVLKDRELLGENGIVIISCTLDKQTKEILGGPEILTRGFVYVKESQDLLEQTKSLAKNVVEENIEKNVKRVNYAKIKNEVRDSLGKFFYQETGSKPMIITVIQEV